MLNSPLNDPQQMIDMELHLPYILGNYLSVYYVGLSEFVSNYSAQPSAFRMFLRKKSTFGKVGGYFCI